MVPIRQHLRLLARRLLPASPPQLAETLPPELPALERYARREDFLADLQARTGEWDDRYRYELALAAVVARHPPAIRCIACGAAAQLLLAAQPARVEDVDWREAGLCSACRLNCRTRLGLALIADALGAEREAPVYFTEQTTPCFLLARQRFPAAVGSEFVEDAARREHLSAWLRTVSGDPAAAVRHEDLTRLGFADGQFAAVACFEVLEHVPDYRAALRELARVLRPGGSAVISVPFLHAEAATRVRARLDGQGGIEHLLPPEYHGDPVAGDGVLCFYHFGWDLLDDLRAAGFASVEYLRAWSLEAGLLGSSGLILARR